MTFNKTYLMELTLCDGAYFLIVHENFVQLYSIKSKMWAIDSSEAPQQKKLMYNPHVGFISSSVWDYVLRSTIDFSLLHFAKAEIDQINLLNFTLCIGFSASLLLQNRCQQVTSKSGTGLDFNMLTWKIMVSFIVYYSRSESPWHSSHLQVQ